jgi:hypothetical protein
MKSEVSVRGGVRQRIAESRCETSNEVVRTQRHRLARARLARAARLNKNAPGLRTSPVKRGNWVVKNVLGEHISPPPPTVPQLPQDELLSRILRKAISDARL